MAHGPVGESGVCCLSLLRPAAPRSGHGVGGMLRWEGWGQHMEGPQTQAKNLY